MKRSLFFVFGLCLTLLLASCGSSASMSGGRGDSSEIILSAKKEFVNKWVMLKIDDRAPMEIMPKRKDVAALKAARIVVTPGRHYVMVTSQEGQPLYEEQVFVSAGASKIIVLP